MGSACYPALPCPQSVLQQPHVTRRPPQRFCRTRPVLGTTSPRPLLRSPPLSCYYCYSPSCPYSSPRLPRLPLLQLQCQSEKDLQPAPEDTPMAGSDEDSDTESLDIVNVDFEMFDPQPAHDFHGLKTLLRQLLDADNTLFDISALAELILSQPLLGTTVKVDGNESDPYAFLTVLNMQEHHDKPIIQQLRTYLLSRAPAALQPQLQTLLAPDAPTHTGLILAERLLNVPTEIVPPMYRMLLEEISWAVADNEPYRFGHFLLLSKTYTEVASRLDDASNDGPRAAKKGRRTMGAGGKKKKKGGAGGGGEVFYFHPEDETIMRRAKAAGGYAYVKEADEGAADSKRAFGEFGIVPRGHMMLVECAALEGVVGDLEGLFRP